MARNKGKEWEISGWLISLIELQIESQERKGEELIEKREIEEDRAEEISEIHK